MLLWRIIMTFEPESVATSDWNRKLVPRQTDEWDFTGNHKHWINRGQLPGNGIWNDLIALVMLSAYILQHLLQGGRYKIENKVHTDKLPNEKKWWQPYFQLHDLQSLPAENWVSHLSSATKYYVHLWKMLLCMLFQQFRLFVSSKYTEQFHLSVLQNSGIFLCVWHVSIMFCLLAMTPPKLHLVLRTALSGFFNTPETNLRGCTWWVISRNALYWLYGNYVPRTYLRGMCFTVEHFDLLLFSHISYV